MPGGRLTHDDRRRIASWLAEGLGYAEIARRLGRPTSTISREVARNRAPGGYLADRAPPGAGRR
ncbi:helix-turn-helix domain-containing protein, partial [Nonomuraea fuscirosea]